MNVTDLNGVIARAAGAIAKRYGSFVQYEDLVQDGWEWVLTRPERLVVDDDGMVRDNHGIVDLVRHLTAVAKRERDARLGLSVGQSSYDRAVVEAVLPGVWDRDYRPAMPEVRTRRSDDPAAMASQWETLVLDVKRAVEQLPARHRKVLFTYYAVVHDWREAAKMLGLGKSRANELGNEAISRIVDILNGVPDATVSDDHGVTGSRRVMSNAQARALTQQQWDGE
jgi:DNA-directed RNA polymerase specialized sigma24 family protein